MAQADEELMQKLVRTSMILRHLDGRWADGPHAHGHHHEGAHCHGEARPHEGAPGEFERRSGHRHGQARVLTMVSMQEGINQKDLAFLLGIRPQSIGELLHKLEEAGMVERRKSESDGRAIEVFLTPAGRQRADEIAERRGMAAADAFAVLSDDEKDQLSALLDKLAAELDRNRPRRQIG